ncbi:MAG: FAD-dependent oxidoreductase [Actinobacteria bacterium]|nr:MAG: FAD-dependent oxidoreductase [Actinomycetota bacterium]
MAVTQSEHHEFPPPADGMHHGDKVPLEIVVSEEPVRGVAGFLAAWRSLATGLGITAKRAMGKPKTVRYPRERVSLSPRWRGALRLTGTLGVDQVALVRSEPVGYNAVVDGMHREDRLPPCMGNCPANVDVRGQNSLIADARPVEAYELVRERNVMPGVLGRICHHPCEAACRRNDYDEPIAVRPLHRVAYEAFEAVREERIQAFEHTSGKHVAIVGAGPAGLAAAADLMRLGHAVTVYEKDHMPGGALNSGVPSYRLPREVLHGEIDDLVRMGLDLRCNTRIGREVPLEHLIGEYDAVLIAAGLQTSRLIPVPGVEAEGVMGAIPFLRGANFHAEAGVRGKRVVVIGGGNVAVDVARCALRVGATEVRQASLESDDEMPAHPWEIEEALDEGVIMMCSLGPHEVIVEDGRVAGMKMRECLSVFDAQGRFSPQFGEEYTDVPCDVVVFAVGQAADLRELVGGTDLMLDERGNLKVHGSTFTTGHDGVFACGEVVTGPGSCIGSIATGHEAAISIHRYLSDEDPDGTRTMRPVPVYDRYAKASLDGVEPSRLRIDMPMSDPSERAGDFRAVELGMTPAEGLLEAARCLRCQSEVCVACGFCARTCPDYAIQVKRNADDGRLAMTSYDLDLTKCCFCGMCAEQCPTDALQHTGQYELSFYHRDLMQFDRDEMCRDGSGTRATGADADRGGCAT